MAGDRDQFVRLSDELATVGKQCPGNPGYLVSRRDVVGQRASNATSQGEIGAPRRICRDTDEKTA